MEGMADPSKVDFALYFKWPEYLVFVIVLIMSMGIGVFYGFFRRQTNEEFLMAGRQMGIFPVTLSVICSFVSAITLLGNPVEVYFYGIAANYIVMSLALMTLSIVYLYLPVFYGLQVTSAYQYIELRFNRTSRLILSISAIIHLLLYMPLTIWGPALALDQVTGMDKYLSSIAIFLVCIAYSSMGGLKAVLWSDVLQGIVMFGSMITVIVFGVYEVGGFGVIWETAQAGGRINSDNFDTDYRTRYSFWSGLFAGYFMWILLYIGTQAQVQRYLSVPSLRQAKLCLFYNLIGLITILVLCSIIGLLLFVKYHNCDPVTAKSVSSSDQLLPLFVMEVLGRIPGVPGLMVAGLTCGSLSTVSSALNALPAIIVEDFVKAWYPDLQDKQLRHLSKTISVVGGLISFSLIFVVASVGGIFQFAFLLHGMFLGPIVGIFTLGMFFPWANTLGSMLGIVPSLGITLFLGLGTIMAGNAGRLPNQQLPLSVTGCYPNATINRTFIHDDSLGEMLREISKPSWKDKDLHGLDNAFAISYVWQPAITVIGTVAFGLIFSIIVNVFSKAIPRKVNSKYLSPPLLKLWLILTSREVVEAWVEFEEKKSAFTAF